MDTIPITEDSVISDSGIAAFTDLNESLTTVIEMQQYTFALLLLIFVAALAVCVWFFWWRILKNFLESNKYMEKPLESPVHLERFPERFPETVMLDTLPGSNALGTYLEPDPGEHRRRRYG